MEIIKMEIFQFSPNYLNNRNQCQSNLMFWWVWGSKVYKMILNFTWKNTCKTKNKTLQKYSKTLKNIIIIKNSLPSSDGTKTQVLFKGSFLKVWGSGRRGDSWEKWRQDNCSIVEIIKSTTDLFTVSLGCWNRRCF